MVISHEIDFSMDGLKSTCVPTLMNTSIVFSESRKVSASYTPEPSISGKKSIQMATVRPSSSASWAYLYFFRCEQSSCRVYFKSSYDPWFLFQKTLGYQTHLVFRWTNPEPLHSIEQFIVSRYHFSYSTHVLVYPLSHLDPTEFPFSIISFSSGLDTFLQH